MRNTEKIQENSKTVNEISICRLGEGKMLSLSVKKSFHTTKAAVVAFPVLTLLVVIPLVVEIVVVVVGGGGVVVGIRVQ